jgi:hypothetical protein
MPSLDKFANGSSESQDPGALTGTERPIRFERRVRIMLFGLAVWSASIAAGCGAADEFKATEEQKSKQQVIQQKQKEFMKNMNLPNRPR